MELSEGFVKEVLVDNRGDLIASARKLGCRPSTLVDWIKSVPSIASTWQEMEKVKADPAFNQATQEQFARTIAERTAMYRLEGLEVLHELATADHDGVASMAEVRLKAAIQLRGSDDHMPVAGDGVLAELNAMYHQSARRIKSMRVAQIEFEESGE